MVKSEAENDIFHNIHHAHHVSEGFSHHICRDKSSCDSPFNNILKSSPSISTNINILHLCMKGSLFNSSLICSNYKHLIPFLFQAVFCVQNEKYCKLWEIWNEVFCNTWYYHIQTLSLGRKWHLSNSWLWFTSVITRTRTRAYQNQPKLAFGKIEKDGGLINSTT